MDDLARAIRALGRRTPIRFEFHGPARYVQDVTVLERLNTLAEPLDPGRDKDTDPDPAADDHDEEEDEDQEVHLAARPCRTVRCRRQPPLGEVEEERQAGGRG